MVKIMEAMTPSMASTSYAIIVTLCGIILSSYTKIAETDEPLYLLLVQQ